MNYITKIVSEARKSFVKSLLEKRNDLLDEEALSEAKINGAANTPTGQRHTEKYIDPYLPGAERHGADTHSLEADHEGLPKGTRLSLKGKKVIKGVTHVQATPIGSKQSVTVPVTKLRKPSDKDGRHNEEHAVKRIWNHFSGKMAGEKKDSSLDDMLGEISKAEKDPKHPLHISHAGDHEFAGKISGNDSKVGTDESRGRARSTYYQNLRDAAHTVHAMRNHPDFKEHWKKGDTLEHSGMAKPELSDHYKKHGVKGAGATSKGDALILKSKGSKTKGIKAISFKKTGGSQLMSSSPAEFHAIYSHAMKQAKIHTPENAKLLQRARTHMENGEHEKANKIVQGLHDKHPDLIRHVTEEALTGNGKFKSDDGRATHVAEIGSGAKVMTTKEFMDKHAGPISRLRPRVRASKHGGTMSTVSLETPRLTKKDKEAAPAVPVKAAKKVAKKKTVVKVRAKK